MTTIAYHHESKTVAVDSRKTSKGGVISSDDSNKINVNDLGAWILCGAVCDIESFITLSKNQLFNNDVKLEVSGLRFDANGLFYVFMSDGIFCEELIDHDFTMGSGQDFALSAMDHGKSAVEAVEYAMTRDIYTGGKVRAVDVSTHQTTKAD